MYVGGLVGNSEGERPPGRLRNTWEDIIKMDLREIGWGGGPVEGSCEDGNEPSGSYVLRNSDVVARLLSSQEGLGSM
jgi:hypothetical protein